MLIRLRALVLAPLLALPLWPALAHAQPGVRAAAIGRDSGATAAAAADTRLRVFLDCQNAPCDRNFFITDLPFSLWTQDRRDADVHLLITRIGTASGGGETTPSAPSPAPSAAALRCAASSRPCAR